MNFLFDVDGTLTPNRLPIDSEFVEEFLEFCVEHKVYLVSGSDYEKLKEQLPIEILKACQAVFACSGNETFIDDQFVSKNIWQPPENLIHILEELIVSSRCPVKTSQHIEIRNGMVNFSTIGRNCTLEQRKQYVEWEERSRERHKLIDSVLSPVFPELQFSTGGQISIDIYPKGTGKEQVLDKLQGPIYFFGDRTCEGGNDRNIAIATLNKINSAVFCVHNWQETRDLLRKLG